MPEIKRQQPAIPASAAAPHRYVLHIKNMVCPQCVRVVREDLAALGLHVARVELGQAEITGPEGFAPDWPAVRAALQAAGFDLLEDSRAQLVERIKTLVVELVHYTSTQQPAQNVSDYLAQHLGRDYHYLSHLFSTQEGLTIEKFVIRQKVERAKELLGYGELTISQVAHALGYSSLAHLSRQFRQVTGLTPSRFQKLGPASLSRQSLDSLI